MADWNKPSGTSTKANFPTEVRAIATNAAKADFTGDTNLPTGVLRYNRTTKQFEEWSGAAWVAMQITNLADGAVSAAAKLADGVVTEAKIGSLAVSSGKLAANSVIDTKIQDGAITENKYANLSIGTGRYKDASITGAKIADGEIGGPKLSDTAPSLIAVFGPISATTTTTGEFMPVGPGTKGAAVRYDRRIPIPRAFKATHLSISASVGAYTVEAILHKNGSSAGQNITLTGGGSAYEAITPVSYAAGDTLEMVIRWGVGIPVTDEVMVLVWGRPA